MTKIRFFLSTLFFALLFIAPTVAQRYKTAAGVRFDNGFNLTVQQYITKGWTIEGILHTPLIASKDLGITLLAEKHHKILFKGTNLYAGAGAHYYWQQNSVRDADEIHENVMGLSGIAGLEVSLGRINLAVDWKPELHLSGDQARPFEWNGASVSLRYIIEKRERKKIKDWKFWDKIGGKKKGNAGKKRK
ncbi:MAG: hypothetical protein Q7T20_14405 [Saprospiraceae bacterium]|nr:hypothetical protein [Saprospiraceae bacterium]